MNMCRFRSTSDSGYATFKSNLDAYLEDIQERATREQKNADFSQAGS